MPTELSIARVIARLNVGGPAIQAILLTDLFRQRGYTSLLIAGVVPAAESSMEYFAKAKNVELITIETMSREISLWDDLLSFQRLVSIFRAEKPSVVHTHTAKAGTLGRLAAIVAGVPVRVHTFHGHVFEGYFSPAKTRLFLALERLLARHTDCIIAVSDVLRQELIERYRIASPKKVKTVRLGFELDRFLAIDGRRGLLRQDIGCPPEAPLVGWIGRFAPVKDPALFVHIAAQVHRVNPTARFIMVGDGELRPEVERLVKRENLSGIVFLLGARRDIENVFSDLDLVVCTSINEGTPLALLEGMAAGRPFVSADVGAVRDLLIGKGERRGRCELFENGALAARSSESLTAAICEMLRDQEQLRKMGSKGRTFVSERYSQHRLADDLERLYLSLLQEKARAKKVAADKHPATTG